MGRLDIRVCAARNLPDTQTFGKPDPYVIVRLEHQQHRTRVCDNSTSPTWDEVFKFTVADPDSSQLKFELWNKNIVSDEFLGVYTLSICGLKRGEVKEGWHLLQQCKTNAELHIRMIAHDFGELPQEQPQHQIQMGGYHVETPPMQLPQGTPYGAPGGAPPQQYQQPPQVPQGYNPQAPAGSPYQQPPQQYQQQQQAGGYPPQQQQGYPPQQQGYPPQQQGYPPQQQAGGYPPQQQAGGYPPQQQAQGYPPQQQGYPPQQQAGGYPPQQQQQYQQPPQQYQQPPQQYQQQQQYGGGAPPGFNAEEYIQLHPDLVRASAGQPDRNGWAIKHWNEFGHKEGRAYSRSQTPQDWNHEQYINKYPDLQQAAAGQPDRAGWARQHWLNHGVPEGRRYR